jgi:small GTP-binding protein
MRFAENQFNLRTNSSVGASFISRALQVDDVSVKLRLWDTAGQERFRALAPMYYRGAAAAVLCYDITAKSSFEKVITWVEELQRNIQGEILLTIVGNKADRAKYRQIEAADGETYAKSVGAKFFEVSAKTGEGIEETFLEIAKELKHSNPEPVVDEDLKKNMNPNEDNYLSHPILLEKQDSSRSANGKQEKSSGCCA